MNLRMKMPFASPTFSPSKSPLYNKPSRDTK
jgi:hypothetical protein